MTGLLQMIGTVAAVPVPWPAIAVLLGGMLLNTAALFYWGGGVRQMIRDHERRIGALEDRRLYKERRNPESKGERP